MGAEVTGSDEPRAPRKPVRRGVFDECAGNFTYKRLRAVLWLVVVVVLFVIVRWYYVRQLNQAQAGLRPVPPAQDAERAR